MFTIVISHRCYVLNEKQFLRSANSNSDDWDEHKNIKFNSDYDLPLKTARLCYVIIVVTSIFNDSKKYFLQVFLDEGLYQLPR